MRQNIEKCKSIENDSLKIRAVGMRVMDWLECSACHKSALHWKARQELVFFNSIQSWSREMLSCQGISSQATLFPTLCVLLWTYWALSVIYTLSWLTQWSERISTSSGAMPLDPFAFNMQGTLKFFLASGCWRIWYLSRKSRLELQPDPANRSLINFFKQAWPTSTLTDLERYLGPVDQDYVSHQCRHIQIGRVSWWNPGEICHSFSLIGDWRGLVWPYDASVLHSWHQVSTARLVVKS